MSWMRWIAGLLTVLTYCVSTNTSRAADPVPVCTLACDGRAATVPVGSHGGHHHGWYRGHGWARGWHRPWGLYARPWLPGFVAWGGPLCVTPPPVYAAPPCGIAMSVLNIVGAVLANRPFAHDYVIEQAPPRTVLPAPTPVLPPPSATPPPIPPQESTPSTGRPAEVVPLPQAVPSKPAPQPTLLQRLAARRAARQLRHKEHHDAEPATPPETERVTLRERREPKP